MQPNTGRQQANFDILINQCGTTGNTQNGFYGYGAASGSGTFFENTVVVQYDPQVQVICCTPVEIALRLFFRNVSLNSTIRFTGSMGYRKEATLYVA